MAIRSKTSLAFASAVALASVVASTGFAEAHRFKRHYGWHSGWHKDWHSHSVSRASRPTYSRVSRPSDYGSSRSYGMGAPAASIGAYPATGYGYGYGATPGNYG